MHQPMSRFSRSESTHATLIAATDPVGGVHDPVPIHPDHKPSTSGDFWKKYDKPRPQRRPDSPPRNKPQPDPDHQVDDYA